MDAETRRTLAATVLSTLVRVSFVFLALHEYDRENGASAQKTENGKTRETRGRGRDGREGEREKERKRKIVPFLILSINVKKKKELFALAIEIFSHCYIEPRTPRNKCTRY